MDRYLVLPLMLLIALTTFCQESAAQNFRAASGADSAAARMRPIGSPSAVDQYRRQTQFQETQFQQTRYDRRFQNASQTRANIHQVAVRQVAMQQSGGFTSPLLPGEVPSDSAAIGQPALSTMPRQPTPITNFQGQPLPMNPSAALPPSQGQIVVSPSDAAPMPQPNLTNGFATVDNCNCVSPASGYSAASGIGCGSNLGYISPASCNTPIAPGYLPQNYGYAAPPAQVPGPAVMPVNPGFAGGGFGTGGFAGGGIGASVPRALISLGQQNNAVQVGQGLWGQPVAYVPGQSVRNWVRYFFP